MDCADEINILLVDDQPAKLLSYEVILADLNHNLIKANSAREAFKVLLKTDIAVLLVDVSMPELDGFQFVAMLREHPRFEKTAVIFISAIHLSELDLLKGYKTGAVDYVSVPVVPEILRAKVTIFAELHRKTVQLEQLNGQLEERVRIRTREANEAAARLGESEERLRLASEAAGFGIYDYNQQTGLIYCSPRLRYLMRLRGAGDSSLETFLASVHEADRPAVEDALSSSPETATRHEIEYRVTTPGGRQRWLLDRGRTIAVARNGREAHRRVMGTVLDVTARKEDEERQKMLMAELDHRVKNILAHISAITHLSGKTAKSVDSFVKSLEGRIQAMSQAHTLLRRNNWTGATLREVASTILEPLKSGRGETIIIEGDPAAIDPKASQSLALIIHELATNAVKYGALSAPGGQVKLAWAWLTATNDSPQFRLSWSESGGPPVAKPASAGFGLTVIETLALELNAALEIVFAPGGFKCTLTGLFVQPQAPAAPANGKRLAPDAVKAPNMTHNLAERRILVVEDEPFVALQLKQQLEDAGHLVIGPASTVIEAIELVRQNALDIALIDVTLGRDISTPVADALLIKQVPFAFSTGYMDVSMLPSYLHDVPRITKPYNSSDLTALIEKLGHPAVA